MFIRELIRHGHTNIVRIVDAGTDDPVDALQTVLSTSPYNRRALIAENRSARKAADEFQQTGQCSHGWATYERLTPLGYAIQH
jgi:hypothetical protein